MGSCTSGGGALVFYTAVVVLYLTTLVSPVEGIWFLFRDRVNQSLTIVNGLEYKVNLFVHCKSQDLSLGVQEIPYAHNFTINFMPNLPMTTAYWCKFSWTDPDGQFLAVIMLVFDGLKGDEDSCKIPKGCKWVIKSKGYNFWQGDKLWGDFSRRRLK